MMAEDAADDRIFGGADRLPSATSDAATRVVGTGDPVGLADSSHASGIRNCVDPLKKPPPTTRLSG